MLNLYCFKSHVTSREISRIINFCEQLGVFIILKKKHYLIFSFDTINTALLTIFTKNSISLKLIPMYFRLSNNRISIQSLGTFFKNEKSKSDHNNFLFSPTLKILSYTFSVSNFIQRYNSMHSIKNICLLLKKNNIF